MIKRRELNSFTPIFRSLVDSSLAREPDFVFKAFVMLLAIKDSDHVARITAFGLGGKCWPMEPNVSEKRAMDALQVLMQPDKSRIEPQPFDGRRIEKVKDGYLVLNGQHYEDLMREISRRTYKARKEREYRDAKAKKTAPSGRERRYEAAFAAGDVAGADAIAAEGLPEIANSETNQKHENENIKDQTGAGN